MHTTSPFTERDAAALDSVVRGLETLEQQRREADAAQKIDLTQFDKPKKKKEK